MLLTLNRPSMYESNVTVTELNQDETVSEVVDAEEIIGQERGIYIFKDDDPNGSWYFIMNDEVLTEMKKEENWRDTMRTYLQGFADGIQYTADQFENPL